MNQIMFFIKYYFSYLIYHFYYAKNKNTIWLVGERFGESANDNGYLFFKYMLDIKKSTNVYFVYNNKDVLNNDFLKDNTNVVKLNSIKHFLLYFRTEYVIVSHGVRDAIPTGVFSFSKNKIKPVIYLQHGIIKFKKIFYNKESYNKSILRFISIRAMNPRGDIVSV